MHAAPIFATHWPARLPSSQSRESHEVTYAGGTFITSDEVAEVLVEYAAALANADRAATVEAGWRLETGDTSLRVLIGPASQLLATPVVSEEVITGSEAFVAATRSRIERLQRPWAQPASDSLDWDVRVPRLRVNPVAAAIEGCQPGTG